MTALGRHPRSGRYCVLIVDDEEVVRSGLQIFLNREGFDTLTAEDGNQALDILRTCTVDTVLSDVEMPNMNGLELLRAAKQMAPEVPFIMITGKANMDYTIEALRGGAMNFVRKPYSIGEILSVVNKAVRVIATERERREVLRFMEETKSFTIPSHLRYLQGLLYYLTQNIPPTVAPAPADAYKIKLSLDEAITNAFEHGNMDIQGSDRMSPEYRGLLTQRESDPAYNRRMICARSTTTRDRVEYTIRDEGGGFDHTDLPDPTDAQNLFKVHGRGIMLMKLNMDEVRFNERGNEIVLIKNAPPDRDDGDPGSGSQTPNPTEAAK